MSLKILPHIEKGIYHLRYYHLQYSVDLQASLISWLDKDYIASYNNDKLHIIHRDYIVTLHNNSIYFKTATKKFKYTSYDGYLNFLADFTIQHIKNSYVIYYQKCKIISYDYQKYNNVYNMSTFTLYDKIVYDTFTNEFTYVANFKNVLVITNKVNNISYTYTDKCYRYNLRFNNNYYYQIINKNNVAQVVHIEITDKIIVTLSKNNVNKVLYFFQLSDTQSVKERLTQLSCYIPNNFEHYYQLI